MVSVRFHLDYHHHVVLAMSTTARLRIRRRHCSDKWCHVVFVPNNNDFLCAILESYYGEHVVSAMGYNYTATTAEDTNSSITFNMISNHRRSCVIIINNNDYGEQTVIAFSPNVEDIITTKLGTLCVRRTQEFRHVIFLHRSHHHHQKP